MLGVVVLYLTRSNPDLDDASFQAVCNYQHSSETTDCTLLKQDISRQFFLGHVKTVSQTTMWQQARTKNISDIKFSICININLQNCVCVCVRITV